MDFKDRQDAGKQLAYALKNYKGKDVVVYALPRGGVVLGTEVAKQLNVPLDLLIPRKIGHPYDSEWAIAAVTEHGDMETDRRALADIDPQWFKESVEEQRTEAKRRRKLYLKNRKPISAAGKIAVIIDDGLATGLTMKAAIKQLRLMQPKQVVVAVPVAPEEVVAEISKVADEVVVLYAPAGFFGGVGAYYRSFDQTSDEEVISLIQSLPSVSMFHF